MEAVVGSTAASFVLLVAQTTCVHLSHNSDYANYMCVLQDLALFAHGAANSPFAEALNWRSASH
jgi:hypothetical protein